MDLTNDNVCDVFNDSILIDYLDNVIGNKPLKEVILKLAFKLTLFKDSGETESIEAIDKNKIDYIIMATKLTTMVEVFKLLQNDENIVMTSDIEKELNRFQEVISQGVLMTNKQLINK